MSPFAPFFQDFNYVFCVIQLYRVYSINANLFFGVLTETRFGFLGPEIGYVRRGLVVPGLGGTMALSSGLRVSAFGIRVLKKVAGQPVVEILHGVKV